VFGWDWLDSRTTSSEQNVLEISPMPINSDDYGRTLYADRLFATAHTEFTLGRSAC